MSLNDAEFEEYRKLSSMNTLTGAQFERLKALDAQGEAVTATPELVTPATPEPEGPPSLSDMTDIILASKPVRLAKNAYQMGRAALNTAPVRLAVKAISPMETAQKAGAAVERFSESMQPIEPPTSSPLAMAQSTLAGAGQLAGKGIGMISPFDVATAGAGTGAALVSKATGMIGAGRVAAGLGGAMSRGAKVVEPTAAVAEAIPAAPTAVELGSGLAKELHRIAGIVQVGASNRIRPAPMEFGGLLTREEFALYSKHKGLVENTRKLGLKPGYVDTLLTPGEKLAHGKSLGGITDPIIPSSIVNDTLRSAGMSEKGTDVERTLAAAGIKTDNTVNGIKDVPIIPKPSWFQSRVIVPGRDMLNDLVTRGHKVLESTGPAGAQLSKLVLEARREGAIRAGSMKMELVSTFEDLKMNTAEVNSLVETLDTGKAPMNPKVADAVSRTRSLMDRVFEEGQGVGLNLKFRENYFPHIHDWDEMLDKSYQSKIVAKWLAERKIDNAAQGFGMLHDYLVKNATRRYGNLERSRDINLPGFERDPIKALSSYFESAFQRIEEARRLGPNDEVANSLLVNVAEAGGDETLAGRIFSGLVKNDSQDLVGRKYMGALKNSAVLADMGLSALQNASQSVNTASVVSASAFRKGLAESFTKDGRKFAEMAGVVLRNSVRDLNIKTGGSGKMVEKFMDITGFNRVEDFNRTLAANAGKQYALELFEDLRKVPGSKDTLHYLDRLGIDGKKALAHGSLTVHDLKVAGYEVARRTQFITAMEELPHFWRSPYGRFVTQFKSFTYMQSVFIKEELLAEVGRGNLAPLAKYAVSSALTGEALKDVRLALTGGKEYYKDNAKKLHETTGMDKAWADATARVVDRIAFSGGFGMAVETMSNVLGDGIKDDPLEIAIPRSLDVPYRVVKGAQHIATGEFGKARKELGSKVPILGKMKWFTEGTYEGPMGGKSSRPERKSRKARKDYR